jgi:hypothetical protein
MDLHGRPLIASIVLFLLAAMIARDIKGSAKAVHAWYHSIPNGTSGPSFWRWQFRPSERQAYLMTLCSLASALALGSVGLYFAFR